MARTGGLYNWLERLGCYSPIIHLQQTDGASSAHLPFTEEANKLGIVDPSKLLRALHASFRQTEQMGTEKTDRRAGSECTDKTRPQNQQSGGKEAGKKLISEGPAFQASMPPKTEHIYLTLEIFSGTSEKPKEILTKMEQSVRYWRRFVPEDGLRLSELVSQFF